MGAMRIATNTDLSCERDGWLVQALLLRVPDIGRDNLVKRQPMVFFFELFSEAFGLDRELATNGVLDLQHGGVE